MATQKWKVSWFAIASNGLFLLGVAAIGYGVWTVARQNDVLVESLEDFRSASLPQDRLAPGDTLPDVPLVSLDGRVVTTAELARQARVVAVLNTTCPFCQQSLSAWDEVAQQLEAQEMGFVGISLHSAELTEAYVRDHKIAWPLLVIDAAAKPQLGVRAVPRTLVLREDGVIDQVVSGQFDGDDRETVLGALGVAEGRR